MIGVISVTLGIIVIAVVILAFRGGKSNYDKAADFLKLLKEKDFEKWQSLGEPRIIGGTIITSKAPFLSHAWAYFAYTKLGDFSDQEVEAAFSEVKETFSIKPFDVVAIAVVFLVFIGFLLYATMN